MIGSNESVANYQKYIELASTLAGTVKAYVHEMADFAVCFKQTAGDKLTPGTVEPRRITDYRGFLSANTCSQSAITPSVSFFLG
jgi:hypothetical protein